MVVAGGHQFGRGKGGGGGGGQGWDVIMMERGGKGRLLGWDNGR